MQHALLIPLNILVIVEAALSVLALTACLRAGTKNPVREMRAYLAVRAASAMAAAVILLGPGQALFLSVRTSLSTLLYYFWFWGVSLTLLILEMRVAAAAIAAFFQDLRGFQSLTRIASRWVAVAGMIVVIPLLLEISLNFDSHAYLHLFRRWWSAFSILQLIPVILALLAGAMRKVRWNSRTVAILLGFAFEPLVQLAVPWSWTSRTSMLQLSNIAHELACCAAVALWTTCYAVPAKAVSLARPTLAMLRLDEMARRTLRLHRPDARGLAYARRGAQPWPKYRRDA